MASDRRGMFTDAMGEISGLGGGYEECCRSMLAAGMAWLDAHPAADPQFHGYKHVYGILNEDNDDAKALTEAVIDAARGRGGATGAMHQAVISHLMFILKNGWDQYVAEMSKKEVS